MKSLIAHLTGSGKKKGSKASARKLERDENALDLSPLAPRRLLSATPESRVPGRQLRPAANTLGGTPKVLSDKQTPAARLQREPSLRLAATAHKAAAGHAAEHTPSVRPSRFAQQEPRGSSVAVPRFDVNAAADEAVPHPPLSGGDNIKVIVRVRPANDRERSLGGATCVHPISATTVRVASTPEPHSFAFDYVAQPDASQESIFRAAGRHIVENCLQGFNGCIFTYGQTGSGKTFTMLGASDDAADCLDESRGLIQRVFEHLFMRIREKQEQVKAGESCKYMLRCSFLEIYNETITDLLNPAATNLAIREDIRKGCFVEGLQEVECGSVEDVIGLLQQGILSRRVGETNMNDKSSRSHCVFTCTLESKTTDASGTTNILFSRLHLVDLAGSERQKASGAQGERLREASSINKSLSTLGHVISSLVDLQSGRARHVPYRDSRLTFLLQDSLGGNAKACLIATISPATVNMAETLSTLRFADNTKRIKNKAVVNEDTTGEAAALRREIKRLREELARAKEGSSGGGGVAEPAWAEGFGSPMRLPALRTISGSPLAGTPGSAGTQQGTRRALLAALRREEAAARQAGRLEAELQELSDLLKVKDADLQRQQMISKLKDSRLARVQTGADSADARVAELQQEVDLLRAKIESHPEVRRFAAENLHLAQEVERLRELVDRNELRCLQDDIGGLRGEMLAMAEALEAAGEEAAAQQAMAQSLRMESELAVEQIRTQAVAEKEIEVSQLVLQLEAEREQLAEAHAARAQLERQVGALQATIQSLESAATALREELSPVRRKASRFEQQLDLVRQESSAAQLRASSEVTLRSQVELTVAQLQQQVEELGAECARLQAANQQLEQECEECRAASQAGEAARAEAEQQRTAELASLGAECGNLRSQLEQERAAAAESRSDHQDALQQLDSMRKRLGGMEASLGSLQRELLDAQEALARQEDEHQAALSAVAESLAAAQQGAQEAQTALDLKEARVAELQQEVDSLAQQHRQLEAQRKHIELQLAQRDGELSEASESMEALEEEVAQLRQELEKSAAEADRLRADLAAAGLAAAAAAAAATERVTTLTAQLEAAAGQLPEKESQLLLARAQAKELSQQLAAKEEALGALQAQLSAKEEEVVGARSEMAAEVAAAAQQVQALLVAQGEVESLREQLAAAQRQQCEASASAAEGQQAVQRELGELRAQLAAREGEVAAALASLAASEAAVSRLEVQQAAEAEQARVAMQGEVSELQARLQALQAQLDASSAEAAAGAAAHAEAEARLQQALAAREEEQQQLRVELESLSAAAAGGAAQSGAQAQLEELVAEREAWIEEMQQQRVAAWATADAAAALERRLAEVSGSRQQLEAELAACREREAKLDQEVTALTGQHNIQQRIQYHKKVKDENAALKEELSKLRIDLNIVSVRYDRAKGELARYRSAAGQASLPDWDEEERLRQSLAVVQEAKIRLEREYEDMAAAVLALARDAASGGRESMPPSPNSDGSDIVLEFGEDLLAAGVGAGVGGGPAPLGTAAQAALEEIRSRQREAQRSMADQEQQIRLLKEASKLQRIRRTSGW